MKQTNNAIKFLMAQYRAIFHNAYFKGLATAAVVTVAMAAGQAQATDYDAAAFEGWDKDTTITADDKLTIGESKDNTNAITITFTGGKDHIISGSAETTVNASGTFVLNGSAAATDTKLTLDASAEAVTLNVKKLEVLNGTVDLKSKGDGSKVSTLTADNITIGKASTPDTPQTTADAAAPAAATAVVALNSGSTLGKATSKYQLFEGAEITVADGGKLLGAELAAQGGKIIYEGNADYTLKSYSEKTPVEQQKAQDLDLTVKGTLTVKPTGAAGDRAINHFGAGSVIDLVSNAATPGTLAIAADANNSGNIVIIDRGVTLTSTGSVTSGGVISVSGGGNDDGLSELRIDGGVLGEFLTANSDVAGGVLLDSNSKLQINGKKVILSDATSIGTDAVTINVKSGTAAANGQLTLKAESTIAGDDIQVAKTLDDGTKLASVLNINAKTLTLGSTDFAGQDKLGFKSATAEDLAFLASKGNTFKLQEAVTLAKVDTKGKAAAGTITGDVNLAADLKVTAGNYTYSGTMTIGSADKGLSVTADSTTLTSLDQASVDFNGKLVLDRSASGTVTVSGTANGAKAILDLSAAEISFKDPNTTTAAIKFTTDANSELKVGDVSKLIFADGSTNGVIFDVKNGGHLTIASDIELTGDQIKNTGVTTSGIQLASGTVEVAGVLDVKQATEISLAQATAADGKLKAQTFQTSKKDADTKSISLKSGTYVAVNALTTDAADGYVVGDAAVVQLGDFAEVMKADGTGVDYHTSETATGTLAKTTVSGGTLNILAGDWTGTDLDVASGSFKVGQDGTKLDAAGDALESSLTVTNLTVTPTSGVEVTKQGTLTTTTADISAGKLAVNGDMTINGKYTAATSGDAPTDATVGVKLGDDAIALGEGATLSLGSALTANAFTYTYNEKEKNVIEGVALNDKLEDGFNASGSLTGAKFSTVKLNLGADTTFNSDGVNSLISALFGTDGTAGTIDLGAAQLNLPIVVDETTGEATLDWSELSSGDLAALPNIETDLGKSTTILIDSTGPILGHFGAVKATGVTSTQQMTVSEKGGLYSADDVSGKKLFAYNEKGEVLGLDIKDNVNFKLVNGGEAGKVTLGTGAELLIDGGAADGKTVLAAFAGKNGTLTLAGDLDITKDAEFGKVSSTAGDDLVVGGDATFSGDASLAGNVNVTGDTTFKHAATLSGQNNVLAKVTFEDDAKISEGITIAKHVVLTKDKELVVGTEASAGSAGKSGYLLADKLDLKGAELFIDPSYSVPSSIVATNTFDTTGVADDKTDAGKLGGTVVALQNSVLAIGVDKNDPASVQNAIDSLEPLFNDIGALNVDSGFKVGAVVYANKRFDLDANDKLVVDSSKSLSAYKTAIGEAGAYQTAINDSALYLGANSALALDAGAFAPDANGQVAPAIDLQDNSKIFAADSAKVILTGKDPMAADGEQIFGGAGLSFHDNQSLTVQTINGWFTYTLKNPTDSVDLELDLTKVAPIVDSVSSPVADTIMAFATGYHNFEDYLDKYKNDQAWQDSKEALDVLGEQGVAGVTYDKDTQSFMKGGVALTSKELEDLNIDKEMSIKYGEVYQYYDNEMLYNIIVNTGNVIDAETTARLAAFGGAPQAALEAGSSTYDSIAGRMGVGVAGVTAAANGQGGSIWVTPVYKSADGDGFEADNKSYGADVTLYGLALGADVEVMPNFKLGGMFNIGSGDADGQGLGSNVSNDFDYFGLGLYAGYSVNAFSLVADLTYTQVDNDIEGNTDLGKLNTSLDSSNLSVGVTGQYQLDVAGMQVTPHAGLRYSMIKVDDYDAGTYAQTDSDSMNVFSIPVGVTLAKEYVSESWTLKPSFDLTITGNFGDTEFDSSTAWTGTSNLVTETSNEFVDSFTYGAAVGFSATSGNFGVGIGLNYTGSSNVDEFGVNANARYMF